MLHYYGLDWLLLTFGLASNGLFVLKSRWGFAFGLAACACGLALAVISGQYGLVIYNILLVGFSLAGFFHWSDRRTLSRA